MEEELLKTRGSKPRRGLVKVCPTCVQKFYVSQAFKEQTCCSRLCASYRRTTPFVLEPGEVVKRIPFANQYGATNYGRLVSYRFSATGMLMRPAWNEKRAYYTTVLSIDRKGHTYSVHRLVAMTFLDNPDGLPQVNHKDGSRRNNHVDNLEWCTASDNIHHSYRELGHIRMKGELAGMARLNSDQVRKIRSLKGSKTYQAIANDFDVKYSTVAHIMRGSRWSHLD